MSLIQMQLTVLIRDTERERECGSMNQKMELDVMQIKEKKEKREMDLKEIEEIVKNPNGGSVIEKKENLISTLKNSNHNNPELDIDSGTALQLFLDHIPITSIPSIKNSFSLLELKTQDYLIDAIRSLHERNVFGAPIADITNSDTTIRNFTDGYIGFIDFASLVLWSLEETERHHKNKKDGNINACGFFSTLQEIPHIGKTKIGELAKSFVWDPFFPVNLEDTLFQVLLLLSKHRLHVVPVIALSESKIVGFVTQIAVIHMLLQSSGLEWFDNLADKALSEFRFENDERVVSIYEDQSIAEAIHVLWENRVVAIAVVQRKTERLVGCVRSSDVYLLLDDDNLFSNRKSLTVGHFIRTRSSMVDSDTAIEWDLGALLSFATLTLRNKFLPRMDSPVTNKVTDTLKQAMQKLADAKSGFSFLVDKLQRVRGVLTLRDIIIQFAPPGVDSRINGGGFFETALEQSGCRIVNGTMICDH